MSTRKGFTLIELLVVIAIIAILAAILFPVFAQAREKARAIACLSNTKQISLAVVQYEQDYDEKTPNGVNPWGGAQGWAGQIYTYVKAAEAYRCADDSTPNKSSDGLTPFHISSYAYNSQVSLPNIVGGNPAGPPDSVSLASYNAPANTVLLAEVQGSTGYDVTRGYQIDTTSPHQAAGDDYPAYNGGSAAGVGTGGAYDPSGFNSNNGTAGGQPWQTKWATGPLVNANTGAAQNDFTKTGRHNGGANYVMADGHAKFFRPSQVSGGGLNTVPGDCGHIGTAATTGCSKVAATFNLL